MADSYTTKRLLASSLKDLMLEKPFEKISISDICDRCQMNRKSFYYHFKDKYDLVNWIFDNEFAEVIQGEMRKSTIEILKVMNDLLYENREFYKKALQIYGQNSFMQHFYDTIFSVISFRFDDIMKLPKEYNFQKRYFTDAIVVTYRRWLLENYEMTPDEFLEELRKCVDIMNGRKI